MRPRIAVVVVAAALALVVAGCSIATDDDPQQLAAEDVPFGLLDPISTTTTTAPDTATNKDFPFYLVRQVDDRPVLVEVNRQVALDAGPTEVVMALLGLVPTAEEEDRGLTNRIPQSTDLVSAAELNEAQRIVTLNLSDDITTIEGQGLRSAFAQIVYTVTELDGIDRVSFEVEGESIPVIIGDSSSTTDPVGRSQYASWDPASVSTG